VKLLPFSPVLLVSRAARPLVFLGLVSFTVWASVTPEGRAAVRTRDAILSLPVPVAEMSALEGEIHRKTPREVNWTKVKKAVKVSAGDLLFVPRGSSVKLFYLKEKSFLTLTEESIFEVEERLPAATKHKRLFGKARYGGGLQPRTPGEDGTFSRLMLNPSDSAPKSKDAGEASGALEVDRKVRSVSYANISKLQLKVVARRYPATLTLVVEDMDRAPLMFGYLWKTGASAEPVWNETSSARRTESEAVAFSIPIPSAGSFVFQAISEDDTLVTMPLRIEALSLRDLPESRLLPEDISSGGQATLLH